MTRIVLADDHPMIRTAIEVLLRDTGFEIVGVAGSGEDAIQVVGEAAPELLLLDLSMPGGSGMDVLRALRSDGTSTRIVVLTAAIDDSDLMEARGLGVQGIVLKNSDPAYLLECLEQVKSGGTWIDPELAERVRDLSASKAETRRPQLAPRERQLIGFVRQGLRNRDIAEQLGVTEGTVKVYLHSIFEKLGVKSRTELAVRAEEFLAESFVRK